MIMGIHKMILCLHTTDMSIEIYHDSDFPNALQYSVCSCADLVHKGMYEFGEEEKMLPSVMAVFAKAKMELTQKAMQQKASYVAADSRYLQ